MILYQKGLKIDFTVFFTKANFWAKVNIEVQSSFKSKSSYENISKSKRLILLF